MFQTDQRERSIDTGALATKGHQGAHAQPKRRTKTWSARAGRPLSGRKLQVSRRERDATPRPKARGRLRGAGLTRWWAGPDHRCFKRGLVGLCPFRNSPRLRARRQIKDIDQDS